MSDMIEKLEKLSHEQRLFLEWLALPKSERVPRTQRLLADKIGVVEDTLCQWKKKPGFIDLVNLYARELVKDDIAEVLGVVRKQAKKGNLPYVNMVFAMSGMSSDIENAGKGPASIPIREVIIKMNE